MLRTEIAELQGNGKMYEVAEKITYNLKMNTEEKEISTLCDAWVKEVAEKGDPDKEIAAFIKRTVNEEIYNAPDELLDMLFDRGTVGEFDDYEVVKTPKNTLIAYEAAKGGTVDRSWIDFKVLKPTTRNRQVAFDISYVDTRKNGFKSIALGTTYATEALQNAFFYDVFSMADAAVTGGDQVITESTAAPTQATMDKLSLYLIDRNPTDSVAVCLSKYAQAIGRMSGYAQYMSEEMKNDFNRYGLTKFYDGIRIAGISSAKKLGSGQLLIPDKKIFGFAGKIGTLDMKGETHVYETMDNQSEVIAIEVKDFTYSFCITDIEQFAKVVVQG